MADEKLDTSIPSQAVEAITGLSMDHLIGAPLNAAIKAQTDASKAVLEFIRSVGLKESDGVQKVVFVTLEFLKNGRMAKLQVPLLTLVPIPTLAIQTATYSFKAKIDGSSSLVLTLGDSTHTTLSNTKPTTVPDKTENAAKKEENKEKPEASPKKAATETVAEADAAKTSDAAKTPDADAANATDKPLAQSKAKLDGKSAVNFSATYSSKKDSTGTRQSKYSVETTMDITLNIGSDDLPAGISHLLEVLGDATEVIDPAGTFTIDPCQLTLNGGYALATAVYRDTEGLFAAEKIKCETPDAGVQFIQNQDSLQLLFSAPGAYTFSADSRKLVVLVN